jgi:hypothetical protein
MYFFPKNPSFNREQCLSILADLKAGTSQSLLEWKDAHNWDSVEGEYILERMAFDRDLLNWFFEDKSHESLFFGSLSKYWQTIYNNYFHFAKKLKSLSSDKSCYYIRNGEVLWNLFVADLLSLEPDTSSHLFLNLKNYLDWGSCQKSLQKPEMLAKILYPYYKSLKSNLNFPQHFLNECLKITLHLNPIHSEASMENFQRLHRANPTASYDFGVQTLKDGLKSSDFCLKLCETLMQDDQSVLLKELAEDIFSKINSFTREELLLMSDILYQAELLVPSLFFRLKGISYDTAKKEAYAPLRKIFYRLSNYQMGDFCYELARTEEPENPEIVFFVSEDNKNRFQYKTNALEDWKEIDNEILIVEPKGKPRIELNLKNSTIPSKIFFPDTKGPFDIDCTGRSFEMKKRERKVLVDTKETTYTFATHEFTANNLQFEKLNPFSFQVKKDEDLDAPPLDTRNSHLIKKSKVMI